MILKSLSLADLQKFGHVLKELESEGVPSLAFARQRVASEQQQRHAGRMRALLKVKPALPVVCPDCGAIMIRTTVDGLSIHACKHCRYSQIEAAA